MLNKHCHETFHRTERGTVNHHRTVFLVILTGVFQLEAFRQVVVHLYGAQLPFPTDGITNHKIEFRTVEGGFTQFNFCIQSFFLTSFNNGLLCFFPVFIAADVFFLVIGVAQRYLYLHFGKVECLENNVDDIHHFQKLVFHLIRAAEDVCIVLREGAYACKSVQFAALLVAIHGAEFGHAHRQVFVGAGFVFVYFAVMRAVHRFQQVFFPFFGGMNGLERVFAVFGVMSRSNVQQFVAYVRCHYLLIFVFALNFFQKIFESKSQCSTFGEPHGQSFAYGFGEHEEFEFAANFAVIAFFGFFEQYEVFVQHFAFREGDAVNSGHHFAFFIAAPVSSRYAEHFDGFYFAGVGEVWSATQIGKVALRVESDGSVGQIAYQFSFVFVAFFTEKFQCIGLADICTYDGCFAGCQFGHFVFDDRQVGFLDDCFARIHVVVETVFDSRADTEFYTRIEFLECFGHEVGRTVPVGMFTFFVVPFIENDVRIAVDRAGEIPGFSVYADG